MFTVIRKMDGTAIRKYNVCRITVTLVLEVKLILSDKKRQHKHERVIFKTAKMIRDKR